MSAETLGLLRGISTVMAMLAFIGVVAWAWSRRRASSFEAAAQLPLEEDVDTLSPPARAGRDVSKRDASKLESSRLES
jgi:cytochrome c oxidase cbb3-type subunit IV